MGYADLKSTEAASRGRAGSGTAKRSATRHGFMSETVDLPAVKLGPMICIEVLFEGHCVTALNNTGSSDTIVSLDSALSALPEGCPKGQSPFDL